MRISKGFIARSRRNAIDLMSDSCRIVRKGEPTTNPDGTVTVEETEVYSGPCKVQTSGGIAGENAEGGVAQALGASRAIHGLQIHLPFGATGLRRNDIAVIAASGNPDLDGRRYRLVNPQAEKTHATAQRWNVREEE